MKWFIIWFIHHPQEVTRGPMIAAVVLRIVLLLRRSFIGIDPLKGHMYSLVYCVDRLITDSYIVLRFISGVS